MRTKLGWDEDRPIPRDSVIKIIITCHDTIVTVVTKLTLDNTLGITRVIQDKSI